MSSMTAFVADVFAASSLPYLSIPTVLLLSGSVEANPPAWSNLACARAVEYIASGSNRGHALAADA